MVKAQWKLFEQSCVDTKDLIDIPEYHIPMSAYHIPKVQYTFREVISGLHFIAHASERSLLFSELFIDVVLSHLKASGVSFPKGARIQSDNGSEFIGFWQARHDSAFTQTVQSFKGIKHTTTPPKAHIWQADVETAHRLIEDEFYRIETFSSHSHLCKRQPGMRITSTLPDLIPTSKIKLQSSTDVIQPFILKLLPCRHSTLIISGNLNLKTISKGGTILFRIAKF